MDTSLATLIQSGPWERALFTSYVFSSSFFETEILRGLRQSGCQQIHVLVDMKGYRDSLRRQCGKGIKVRDLKHATHFKPVTAVTLISSLFPVPYLNPFADVSVGGRCT